MTMKAIKLAFWRTRKFITCAALVVVSCLSVGYMLGTWITSSAAQRTIRQQDEAYKEAGDARKSVMQQCLNNNAVMSKQLADLGIKASNAASEASKAINNLSSDEPTK